MDKEIIVPFEQLGNSQTITENNIRMFKENGLDIHKNEVTSLIDDHSARKRIYKIKSTKFFGPWKRRG